ncbi:MAG: DUF6912 family protein [Dermatophilaceae bacterium]
MPVTRVYVPVGPDALDGLAAGRPLSAPLTAHAVTPAVGRPGLVVDEEELEHSAWLAAVMDAADLTDGGTRRRVVAAADVESSSVVPTGGPPSRVEVTAPVERSRVVSFHIDEKPGATGPHDLLWYDVTELDAVHALLGMS